MNAGNGHAPPRAARRRVTNNTPTLSGAGAAGDALAQAIAVAVAQAIAPMLAHAAQSLAQQQKVACVYCAGRRKLAEHTHLVNVTNALTAAEPEPEAPELPTVQEAFTWVPIQVDGRPPVSLPVCYDDLPATVASPAGDPAE